MATSLNNEHCQCIKKVSKKCKIKVEKFHIIILWCFGAIKKKAIGGIFLPPVQIELKHIKLMRKIIIHDKA